MRAGAPVPQDLLPDTRVGAECWNAGPMGGLLKCSDSGVFCHLRRVTFKSAGSRHFFVLDASLGVQRRCADSWFVLEQKQRKRLLNEAFPCVTHTCQNHVSTPL